MGRINHFNQRHPVISGQQEVAFLGAEWFDEAYAFVHQMPFQGDCIGLQAGLKPKNSASVKLRSRFALSMPSLPLGSACSANSAD